MEKILRYIGRYWYAYLFAVVCLVAAIALDMMYPVITKRIVDDVILGGQAQLLGGLLAAIALIGVGRGVGGYLAEFIFDVVSTKIGSRLRKDLFAHIEGLSMDYFDATNTGELMARVKDDVDLVWNALGYVGMLMIEVIIHVFIVLYCMFSLNWKLAILPLAVMLLMGFTAVFMERKLNKIWRAYVR